MGKRITALDVFFDQNDEHRNWHAWFSVSWSDGSISSWHVELPVDREAFLPGLPDHEWIAGILAMAAKREVQPGDICVTMSSPNIATLFVAGSGDGPVDTELVGAVVDRCIKDGLVVQLPLHPDVSRETDA